MSLLNNIFTSYDDLNAKIPLHLSQGVLSTIHAVVEGTEPFDDPDFCSVNYINTLFPTEQSLSNVDETITEFETKINNIDNEMRILLREQINAETQGREALLHAQQFISQLFEQVLQIKKTSEQSEETVKVIINDIKQLDCAKQNLTLAITTLNHLHILIRGINTIKMVSDRHIYKEVVGPLQGVIEVMKHLQIYTGVSKVKNFIAKVLEVQEILTQQASQDFHKAITRENFHSHGPTDPAEICLVIDILGSKVKDNVLTWFVNRQLEEYFLLFNQSEDVSWLDKIECRFTWFKKYLMKFENKFSSIFPPKWEVSKRITVKFCHGTKEELAKIMAKRSKEIDVKLLSYACQKTSSFERLLAVKFSGSKVLGNDEKLISSDTSNIKNATLKSYDISKTNTLFECESGYGKVKEPEPFNGKQQSIFHNIICEAFIPYLYIFIDNMDRCLFEMIEKFSIETIEDFKSKRTFNVLSSCADLFVLYKRFLVQCSQLSNGPPLISLSSTFRNYLREYAQKILLNNLPRLRASSTGNPLSATVSTITREISPTSLLLQSILKEGEEARFSKAEIAKICCILTTAEYCLETTKQLEDKLKNKVDLFLSEKVNFSQELNIFDNVITNCIQLLVSDLVSPCHNALNAMTKIQWQSLESAGDQSGYVTIIISHLNQSVPFIKESLASSRKYFTLFCVCFAKDFVVKIVQSLYRCKPLSIVGAEQLLLDTQTLKSVLLSLPNLGSVVTQTAPDIYTQIVIKNMSYGEKILKLVMAPNKPEAAFVDQFLNLIPNANIQEFQKILDMKGLRATEKSNLLTVFCVHNSEGKLV